MAKKETDNSAAKFQQKVDGTGNAALDKAVDGMFKDGQVNGEGVANMIEASMKGVDDETLAQMPGVVVDSDTGDTRLFGFKVTLPREMVAGLSALYVGSLKYINDNLGPKTYEGIVRGLEKTGANHRVAHAGGVAGELGSIILATHWQDLGAVWSARRDHQKDLAGFARQVSPVVDEIKGKHGIGVTMSVKKSENEVIWAERQRLSASLRLDLLTTGIAASGRATEVIRYVIDRRNGWNTEGEQASNADNVNAGEKKRAEANKKVEEQLDQIHERTEMIRKSSNGELSYAEARERAEGQLGKVKGAATGAALDALRSENPAGFLDQIKQILPTIGTGISETYAAQYMAKQREKISAVSAYDMIMTLTSQLDNDPTMDAYALPDGMKLEDGRNELPLNKYVAEIFRRHEADMEAEGKIAKRLDEKLHDATEVIAEALKDGDIDGLSLISLVGERHIIKVGAKSIVDKEQVRDEVRRQMVKSRKHTTVDEAEYYSERSFTRHDLEDALASLEGDEKLWFASMFPDNVLEGAGMKQDEIKLMREASQEDIGRHVLAYARGLEEQGEDFLKAREATKEEQKRIIDAAHTSEDDDKALRDLTPKPGKVEGVSHDIAQVLVQHIKHQGKLTDIIEAKQEAAEEAVNDNEHIANDNVAGDPDMKVDAASISHEQEAAHGHTIH